MAAVRRASRLYTVARTSPVRVDSVADSSWVGSVTVHRGAVDVTTRGQLPAQARGLQRGGREDLWSCHRGSCPRWPRGSRVSGPQLAAIGRRRSRTSRRPARRGARHDRAAAPAGLVRPVGRGRAVHRAGVDMQLPTIFVHDGHPAARFSPNAATTCSPRVGGRHPGTRSPSASASPAAPVPACSPKCGNRNNPLDKAGALRTSPRGAALRTLSGLRRRRVGACR
ncbi:hypothetical protein QJS66_18745 [Kocuria rhizophila]|nr:hypothetical protein QJS66_18745 [Kocuria rhizophila]